jgi:hypothetical protein
MNQRTILIAIAVAIVTGGIAAVFIATKNQSAKTTVQSDALLVKVTKEELLKESDAVVIGLVQDIQSFKAQSEIRPGKEDIFSNVTLQVNEYLYNPKNFAASQMVVRVLGGVVENTIMTVSDGPVFEKGEQVIVFLKQKDERIFVVVGWAQGKYTIDNGVIGKGNEKIFVRDIFGRDFTVDDFRKEMDAK